MKLWLLLPVLFFFGLPARAQSDSTPVLDYTTAVSRASHIKYLKDTFIPGSLQMPPSNLTSGAWGGAFWAMELIGYKGEYSRQQLTRAWDVVDKLSEGFQKKLLEATYTLFPTEFIPRVKSLLQNTSSPAVFARSTEYLVRAEGLVKAKALINSQLNRFPGTSVLLEQVRKRLSPQTATPPSLSSLFNNSFLPGETVIFSLHRKNRNYPGLVVIRTPEGSLLKDGSGKTFHTTQLARAITGYPFYITNGNTPQGIFRWTGFDTSESIYIGPTTNLQMVMPHEAPAAVFFNDTTLQGIEWTKEQYSNLVPPAWRSYEGLYESYYAGAIGRSEIIMHGTTIDPAYYAGKSFYPNTPSLGCLCSYEAWDAQGRRTVSNQQKIVDALAQYGASGGYVVVIDLDNQESPVTLSELEKRLGLYKAAAKPVSAKVGKKN